MYCKKLFIKGIDKLQSVVAHAVYMDNGVKNNFERTRALGSF